MLNEYIKYLLSMSAYYSLPRVKLNKKSDVKKLNNFSNVYSSLFYKEKSSDIDVDLPSAVAQKIVVPNEPLTDDVKNFLLGTSDYAQEIQSDIDLYVTHRKHNEASFRRKLDPIEKMRGEKKIL